LIPISVLEDIALASEPEIRIDTREDLLYLLSEASEIEHNLMCCYLFAAWSMKRGEIDGLSPEEAKAARKWNRAITSVAVEEMTHLALAANLMVALGGAPHFSRPNFPVAPGYHPSGVVVELARFCHDTLDHFIYLERPEGNATPDAQSFVHANDYSRLKMAERLMPGSQDYGTVGHLYRAIRAGILHLSQSLGEGVLFCGDPASQLSQQDVPLPGLDVVTDVASACRAIDTIVEQGEGAPGHSDAGHYARFLGIKAEYEALQKANPSFDPAHPVARNPVMRQPVAAEGRVHVTNPEAALTLDVANSLYGLMLRCLSQSYGRPAGESDEKRLFVDVAISIMGSLVPVAEYLATLPANPLHPGVNAGVTFTMLRDVGHMPQGASERILLAERMTEIATRADQLYGAGHSLGKVGAQLTGLAKKLRPQQHQIANQGIEPAMPEAPAKNNAMEIVEGKDLTIQFDSHKCIHSRFCVLDAPSVFRANTPGAWIFPDAMRTEALISVAHSCPSGAISYKRRDGGPDEEPPAVNTLKLRENGPYAIHANIALDGASIGYRATLCRCGASKNKPYCDGSHSGIAFKASGEPETRASQALAARDGELDVRPLRNGPLAITGNLEICSGTGRTIDRIATAKLCRCGGSANKPFCDGTHARIGFEAD
jgi:CDGSH-type Zn-finger protein/uncharacterized Fe-S cluster protein YjdI